MPDLDAPAREQLPAEPTPPGDLDAAFDAWRSAAAAEATAPEAPPADVPDPAAAPEAPDRREPAAPEAAPDSDPEGEGEESPVEGVSRRQWAEIRRRAEEQVKAQRAEIERLEREKAERDTQDAELNRRVAEFLGSPEEADDLERRLETGDPDAAIRYAELVKRNRFYHGLVRRSAEQGQAHFRAWLGEQYAAASRRDGVDPAKLRQAGDLKSFLDVFAEGITSHATEPLKERVAELEAEVASLKTRAAGAGAVPAGGGRSNGRGGLSAIPLGPDGLMTDEWLEEAKRGAYVNLDLGDR